ncbi:phytoene desaturase [Serinibacter arcticus]|uniref:Phytoene desaturase n=1 Tax=Serinibacter arcticus TaxID=1655435 RepID=A0A2U1ZVI6_9MICO|nr:phytoene desaturase family protein [Serinibacter arcticus]PWD51005.1 phytoene desaturase [Serinibacter arcticus]
MARVVVIGAGIAGLASAALLARDGHDVEVLERGSRVGGRAGWIDDAGFRFDTGPSWYLMADVYEHFAEMLGTTMDELVDLQVLDGYTILAGDSADTTGAAPAVERLDVPRGEEAVTALAESLEPGAGEELGRYLASARSALGLALEEFLYNPYSAVGAVVNPRVLGAAPDLARWLSTSLSSWSGKRFTHPLLRQMLQYNAIFLGADPRKAPAIYHLMSHIDLVEGVRYPKGGFTAFVESLHLLALEAGARITLNAEVSEIVAARRGGSLGGLLGASGEVRGVRWTDADGRERRTRADVVVSAADLHHTETELLAPDLRTYPERAWTNAVPGPSSVLVMLGVDGELPSLPHHTLLLTRDWEAGLDAVFEGSPTPEVTSLYVCKPSASDDGVAPEGAENVFLLVPVSGEIGLGRGTGYPRGDAADDGEPAREPDPAVEHIADAAIAQVARWAGIPDLADRIRVRHTLGPGDFGADYHSWKDGMLGPSHVLRQSAMFRRGPASRRVDGLYYAGGTAAPGVGVPMCLISAELVLKSVRGDTSAGPIPIPAPVPQDGAVPA